MLVARILNGAQCDDHDHGDERQINPKNQSPAHLCGKESTHQRPDRLRYTRDTHQCPESGRALLVNVDNDTLRRVLDNPEAMAAVERIEGWRSLGDNIIETIINKSDKVKELKNKAKDRDLTAKQKKQLTDEEKEYKSKRKLVQEKLIKFATRIPAFMYLTDFRENTLQDVITKIEPDLFLAVTGLTVKDFHLLVKLKVFNTEQMNQAVFAFRRYEDASLRYTGIESHEGLTHYGLYDTVVAKE